LIYPGPALHGTADSPQNADVSSVSINVMPQISAIASEVFAKKFILLKKI
jgi:hypothetical protein